MFVFLHELGHYLENEYPGYHDDITGVDSSEKIRVDTRGFHDISFVVYPSLSANTDTWGCLPLREDAAPYDFMTAYSINKINEETCESERKFNSGRAT